MEDLGRAAGGAFEMKAEAQRVAQREARRDG